MPRIEAVTAEALPLALSGAACNYPTIHGTIGGGPVKMSSPFRMFVSIILRGHPLHAANACIKY